MATTSTKPGHARAPRRAPRPSKALVKAVSAELAKSSSTSTGATMIRPMVMTPSYLNRQPTRVDPLDEIGTSGLRQFGGFVLEEWLAQLQGRKGAWAYREMIDNDPVVGGVMFAVKMLIRGVRWWVDGDDERADFVWSCMHDMGETWDDFISEALSMVGYGYAAHEIVYKKRQGPQDVKWTGTPETEEDSSTPGSSQYKDGKIGWRKLPVRAQETTLNWDFDGYSGIRGLNQIDWHGGYHTIPIQKMLLFRTETTRNNPEGRSLFRNAWVPFYSVKNVQSLELIGIERELAGIPVATPPEGVDLFLTSNQTLLAEVKKMVTSIKRDEYEGIVLPTAGWKLELLKTGGSRQIDTDTIVRRYEQRIASSVLADFILVGQDAIGSYAMVDVKADLFGIALDTILDMIADVINRYAIPRLMAINGMSIESTPRVCHSTAGRVDLERLGNFFYHMSMAGAPIPWSKEMIADLFMETGLPVSFDGAIETEAFPTGQVHRIGPGDAEDARHEESPRSSVSQQGPQLPAGKPVEKADAPEGLVPVGDKLAERARALAGNLDSEVASALAQLGEEAATAFMAIAQKADNKSRRPRSREITQLVQNVLRRMSIKGWIEGRLLPILRNHAGRVAGDTNRVLQSEVGPSTRVPDTVVHGMAEERRIGLRDVEPQVRRAVRSAIEEGYAAGEHPSKIAQRIRESVPAGRFTKAGPSYRARLIARDQTAEMQREAALGAYESNPHIKKVRIRDGIYGPPRSDAQCIERDGQEVPIGEARSVAPYHPQCTLGFEPIVSA